MKKLLLLVCIAYPFSACHSEELIFNTLAKECAKNVHHDTMQALVRVESGFNPYAIGVVGEQIKQPTSFAEAVETAKTLFEQRKNFSLGLAQINISNLTKYGLTFESVFDPCKNLQASSAILGACYDLAKGSEQEALQRALSCYYSGNFRTGFIQDLKGKPTYVERVKIAARENNTQAIVTTSENTDNSTDNNALKIPALNPNIVVSAETKSTKSTSAVIAKVKPKPAENDRSTNKPKQTWDAFGDF